MEVHPASANTLPRVDTDAEKRRLAAEAERPVLRLFEVRTPFMTSALVLETTEADARKRAIAADESFSHVGDHLEVFEMPDVDLTRAGVIFWTP